MFALVKPSRSAIERFLARQQDQKLSYPEIGATRGALPSGYTIDRNRVLLGYGAQVFQQAIASLRAWRMFDLGWVQLFEPGSPIEKGTTVAVLVNHFGFWSLNACRIVYVFEEERRFGFAYGTLRDHAEQGEERFSIEWAAEDDSVCYEILAFSRPQRWPVKLLRPVARMMQRRFASDSMAAMARAVNRQAEK